MGDRTAGLEHKSRPALQQLLGVLPRSCHNGRLSSPADETADQSLRQNQPGSDHPRAPRRSSAFSGQAEKGPRDPWCRGSASSLQGPHQARRARRPALHVRAAKQGREAADRRAQHREGRPELRAADERTVGGQGRNPRPLHRSPQKHYPTPALDTRLDLGSPSRASAPPTG